MAHRTLSLNSPAPSLSANAGQPHLRAPVTTGGRVSAEAALTAPQVCPRDAEVGLTSQPPWPLALGLLMAKGGHLSCLLCPAVARTTQKTETDDLANVAEHDPHPRPDLQLRTPKKGSFLSNAPHFISQMTLRENTSHTGSLSDSQSQDEENPPWVTVCFGPSPLFSARGKGSHKRPEGREAKQEPGKEGSTG